MKIDDFLSENQIDLLNEVDTDGDGISDLYLYDSNGDGQADIIGVDNDGDTVIDTYIMDGDHNGTFETILDGTECIPDSDMDQDAEKGGEEPFFSSVLSPDDMSVRGLPACSYKCIMSYCYPPDLAKGIGTKNPHPSNSKVGHS